MNKTSAQPPPFAHLLLVRRQEVAGNELLVAVRLGLSTGGAPDHTAHGNTGWAPDSEWTVLSDPLGDNPTLRKPVNHLSENGHR